MFLSSRVDGGLPSYCPLFSRIPLSHYEEPAPISRSQKTACGRTKRASTDSTSQCWLAAIKQDHIQSAVYADEWGGGKGPLFVSLLVTQPSMVHFIDGYAALARRWSSRQTVLCGTRCTMVAAGSIMFIGHLGEMQKESATSTPRRISSAITTTVVWGSK